MLKPAMVIPTTDLAGNQVTIPTVTTPHRTSDSTATMVETTLAQTMATVRQG